jgi:hypothetical protein
MTARVHVNVMRPTYAPDLLDRVRAQGFTAELSAEEDGATVEVEANGSARQLWLAVESWLDEKSIPLVPVNVDAQHYVLRPPVG